MYRVAAAYRIPAIAKCPLCIRLPQFAELTQFTDTPPEVTYHGTGEANFIQAWCDAIMSAHARAV